MFTKEWGVLIRSRAIGNEFDVDAVGYVPWKGTANLTMITGPMYVLRSRDRWSSMFQYGGFSVTYEDADLATDWVGALGLNMQFRSNWGFETTVIGGRSKDEGITVYVLRVRPQHVVQHLTPVAREYLGWLLARVQLLT